MGLVIARPPRDVVSEPERRGLTAVPPGGKRHQICADQRARCHGRRPNRVAQGAGFGFGSPLEIAVAFRGVARWWLGRPGWRQDLHDAVAMARNSDPATFSGVVIWTYGYAIPDGVLRADDSTVRAIEEAVHTAEASSNDVALSVAEYTLGVALLSRDAAADRHRGLELMVQARDIWLRKQIALQMVPVVELWAARERARRGDRDAAIPVMR